MGASEDLSVTPLTRINRKKTNHKSQITNNDQKSKSLAQTELTPEDLLPPTPSPDIVDWVISLLVKWV
jgi:hypothetical protein